MDIASLLNPILDTLNNNRRFTLPLGLILAATAYTMIVDKYYSEKEERIKEQAQISLDREIDKLQKESDKSSKALEEKFEGKEKELENLIGNSAVRLNAGAAGSSISLQPISEASLGGEYKVFRQIGLAIPQTQKNLKWKQVETDLWDNSAELDRQNFDAVQKLAGMGFVDPVMAKDVLKQFEQTSKQIKVVVFQGNNKVPDSYKVLSKFPVENMWFSFAPWQTYRQINELRSTMESLTATLQTKTNTMLVENLSAMGEMQKATSVAFGKRWVSSIELELSARETSLDDLRVRYRSVDPRIASLFLQQVDRDRALKVMIAWRSRIDVIQASLIMSHYISMNSVFPDLSLASKAHFQVKPLDFRSASVGDEDRIYYEHFVYSFTNIERIAKKGNYSEVSVNSESFSITAYLDEDSEVGNQTRTFITIKGFRNNKGIYTYGYTVPTKGGRDDAKLSTIVGALKAIKVIE